jgi:hypothetical protein
MAISNSISNSDYNSNELHGLNKISGNTNINPNEITPVFETPELFDDENDLGNTISQNQPTAMSSLNSKQLQNDPEILALEQAKANRNLFKDRVYFSPNQDGSTTAEFYMKPTFYIDENNSQQFIDTTIEQISQPTLPNQLEQPDIYDLENNYNFQSVKNNLKTYFRKDYLPNINNNLIYLSEPENNYPLEWQPIKLAIFADNAPDINLKTIFEPNLQYSSSKVIDSTIIFNDIYPGCDDRYTVQPNQLKHDLIINQLPVEFHNNLEKDIQQSKINRNFDLNYYGILSTPPEFGFYLSGSLQSESFETSGSVELKGTNNDCGGLTYKIHPPVAYEQITPGNKISCKQRFIPLNSEYPGTKLWTKTLVILQTDLAWLNAQERKFPIVIDPSIEIRNGVENGVGQDTYLVQGNKTESNWTDYNFGSSPDLKVSIAGPSIFSFEYFLHRSILKFPGINSISSYANILEAELILWSKNPGNISISVYKLFDDWLEGNGSELEPGNVGATWNSSGYNMWTGGNFDGYYISHATVEVGKPDFYKWNIRDIVRGWVSDPLNNPNYGLLLTGTDKEDVIKIFHSSDSHSISVRPKIKIKYNTPPIKTGLDSLTVYEGQTKYLNRKDLFIDPDVDIINSPDDEIEFEIWNGTAWVNTGINESLPPNGANYSAELLINDTIVITPFENEEEFGTDTLKVRVKDISSIWKRLDIKLEVISVNDPPEIIKIGSEEVNRRTSILLDAQEDVPVIYPIEVYDPDNPDFDKKDNPKADDAGDIDFDWSPRLPLNLDITDMGDLTFNPDNSLVGTFYMNLTVYDTIWREVGPTVRKYELSNSTIELVFTIMNTNDKPTKPIIVEPNTGSEFSTVDSIMFRGKCTDVDLLVPNSNEKLTFKWILGDGEPIGQGNQITTGLAKGHHLITLRVEDIEGEFNEANVTVVIRNQATIDALNCTYYYTDEQRDVLCYYYSSTDEGVEEFKTERGTFNKYNIGNIDITDFTSVRFRQQLLINLTIDENISTILSLDNHEYDFSIYLVKPTHREEVAELTGLRYLGGRFNQLYKPEDYYAKFTLNNNNYQKNGLDKFSLINKGQTLSLKVHLGDLEAGEGDYSKLRPDFSIFAVVKIEVQQHPAGYFEHIICYDSVGYGGQVAPFPQKVTEVDDNTQSGTDSSVILASVIIIVIIIAIIIVGMVMFRREAKRGVKESKIVYDTSKLGAAAQGQTITQPKPSLPTPFGPPGGFQPGPMGPMGMPMNIPMNMPMPPGPGAPGYGHSGPMMVPPLMVPPIRPGMPMHKPIQTQTQAGKKRITPLSPGQKQIKKKK